MSKTKILLPLLLSIIVLALIIACPNINRTVESNTTAPTIAATGHTASGSSISLVFDKDLEFAMGSKFGSGFKVETRAKDATVLKNNTVTSASISGNTLYLEVTDKLTLDEIAKIFIVADAVQDTAGNKTAESSLEVPINQDTTRPTVSKIEAIATTNTVTVIFNESIMLKDGTKEANSAPFGIIVQSGAKNSLNNNLVTEVSITARTLTLTLSSTLVNEEKVKVSFSADAIQDLTSNKIVKYDSPETTTTIDDVAPTVVKTFGTDTISQIQVVFSEPITLGDGKTFSFLEPTGITVTSGASMLEANAITMTGIAPIQETLVLTVANPLKAGDKIKVEFTTGSIKDIVGNKLAATNVEGTTFDIPPIIKSVEATEGTKAVKVTFYDIIIRGSVTDLSKILVATGSTTTTKNNIVTAAIVNTADAKVLDITVTDDLVAPHKIKVTFGENTIIDSTGNTIEKNASKEGSITVPDNTAPTITSIVAIGDTKAVKVIFSEAIKKGSVTDLSKILVSTGATIASKNNPVKTVSIDTYNTKSLDITVTDDLVIPHKIKVTFGEDTITDISGNALQKNASKETIIASYPTFIDGKAATVAAPAGITVITLADGALAETSNPVESSAITNKALVLTLINTLQKKELLK